MKQLDIIAEDISFAYGDKTIVKAVSLKIKQGSHIGLVGPSGCGKSTLLKLIAGLYPVSEGKLTVMGQTRCDQIRRNISMVMQNSPLFPTSLRDNITCGHAMSEEKIWAACEAAQLTDWIMSLPDKLDTFAGQRGNNMSGGQAQRIAIARAIAKDAPVVLLDEATSALDGETERAVVVALAHLMEHKTVVSSSHRLNTLEGFDEVYRMKEGVLVCENRANSSR